MNRRPAYCCQRNIVYFHVKYQVPCVCFQSIVAMILGHKKCTTYVLRQYFVCSTSSTIIQRDTQQVVRRVTQRCETLCITSCQREQTDGLLPLIFLVEHHQRQHLILPESSLPNSVFLPSMMSNSTPCKVNANKMLMVDEVSFDAFLVFDKFCVVFCCCVRPLLAPGTDHNSN